MTYLIIVCLILLILYIIWCFSTSSNTIEPNKYQVGDIIEFLFYNSNKTMRGSGEILKVKDQFHYGNKYIVESIATYESFLLQREWKETKCFDIKEEDIIRKIN